jgi:hypothetical protein
LYVDDTIGGGTPALFDTMPFIGSVIKVGAEQSAKDGPFSHAMRVFVLLLARLASKSQEKVLLYSGRELNFASNNGMCVISGEANEFLSPIAATEFHSVAGCIGYMEFHSGPH